MAAHWRRREISDGPSLHQTRAHTVACNVKPPQARHLHPNISILIIKPITPIFKIQIAQIKATVLIITEENGLEVFRYIMGVISHLVLAK